MNIPKIGFFNNQVYTLHNTGILRIWNIEPLVLVKEIKFYMKKFIWNFSTHLPEVIIFEYRNKQTRINFFSLKTMRITHFFEVTEIVTSIFQINHNEYLCSSKNTPIFIYNKELDTKITIDSSNYFKELMIKNVHDILKDQIPERQDLYNRYFVTWIDRIADSDELIFRTDHGSYVFNYATKEICDISEYSVISAPIVIPYKNYFFVLEDDFLHEFYDHIYKSKLYRLDYIKNKSKIMKRKNIHTLFLSENTLLIPYWAQNRIVLEIIDCESLERIALFKINDLCDQNLISRIKIKKQVDPNLS
jgi:hypothetical protein